MRKNKDITLVLSGGGARGLAHIGVIEELNAQGYQIKSITGTSMGALVGGLYAMGKLEEFKLWVSKLNRYSVLRLLDFSFKSGGLIKGEKVLNLLRILIPGENIENLQLPFQCVATDLQTQQAVVFNSGKIYDAIHASIAIPGIFNPIQKGEMVLVDGGVLNNIPTQFAIKTSETDKILAVNANAKIPYGEIQHSHLSSNMSMFRISNRSISLMMETIGNFNLKEYPADFMISLSRYSCELYEFYKAEQQIEYGRKVAREQLSEYPF
ncbi:patatin-like phospholipase family protein [Elizabethkingia sp. JS20170427COW]|uniref:patatin-like phospholipase family protein n=1 Tax=Elizabethkingia sp. JS20170427COW TaxID=2583851 RepID=UPI0011103207|nr:patatin-like phospholipase family protein [Elizabethkingia sp. JS20170427COW]QCX54315.1 alpha/beta hydrolase [Elizabethkingia sp. JS20170427COW]